MHKQSRQITNACGCVCIENLDLIMENKIVIQNFGPVKEAQINLNKKFQIFIGAQASGKSTICKVVYFVQNIEENISFV